MDDGLLAPGIWRKGAVLAACIVAALGAAVLFGWWNNVRILESPAPGAVTMKPNTALLLLLQGIAIAVLSRAHADPWSRRYASIAGSISIALAALSLGEAIFGWELGIDQWLFAELPGAAETMNPGRMSPPASYCLLLTGAALLVASQRYQLRIRAPIVSALGATVLLVGGLTLAGHLLWLGLGLHFWNYSGFAIHTAAGCLLLGVAILCWTRSQGTLNWSLDVPTTLGFAIGVLAILVVAGISYSLTGELRENWSRVSHSQEVLRAIEKLGSDQRDLTLSLGRYVISRDEESIARRPQVILAITEDINRIRHLTANEPWEQIRIEQLELLTKRRIALSDQLLAKMKNATAEGARMTAQSTGSSPTRGLIESPLGKEYPAVGIEIDHELAEMDAAEYSVLELLVGQSESGATRTFLQLPVGVYLSLTFLFLGLFHLNQWALERAVAERDRREIEAYFRTMFDASPDGIVVTDAERKIVMVNPATETMFGYVSSELTGQRIDALVPFTDAREVANERAELMGTPGTAQLGKTWETEATRKNGSVFPLEFRRSAFSTSQGVFVLGVTRDISERKRTNETTARMAAIVEFSDDAIIGKNLEGIVSSWNRGAQKIFGYSAQEMVGQSILRIVPSDRAEEELEILRHVSMGETIEHFETIRQTKDGHLIDVAISVSPIQDSDGRVIGASKIGRDITASKQLEQRLRQSQKMEAIGQLTGGIAHDFNNLLGVVLGNLDLLERLVASNDSAVKRVQNAQKAALRGADLTRRLLGFSSRQPLNAVAVTLRDPIENTIEMAKRALGPEIKITAQFDERLPAVLVDSSGLENALLNLAVNARDAMPAGGSILISTSVSVVTHEPATALSDQLSEGSYACIRVSDTGEGMAAATLERAFEPFFTTKSRGKGTGLGLAMVYGFAKQSGGAVRIYSEQGVGTTISLYLPLAEKLSADRPASPKTAVPVATGQTVLVVDDEVDLLEIAIAYLEDMGFVVLHATDGKQAIDVLAREPRVALLMTDIIMPGGMNGVELARRARILVPLIKVVFSSGFPSDALAQRSGTKVDGPLLYKPYQRQQFVDLVSQTLSATGRT